MSRRKFIGLVGAAAVAWPLTGRAQQTALPIVGFLHSASPELNVKLVAAFRKGLGEAGLVEGQNMTIEFRWAAEQNARLPELAADLVRRKVAVIATPASTPAALAARAATTTIPIVFAIGADPVALGLVASLNHPGANVTGVSFQTVELSAKRLGMLRELAPQATRFVALVNPKTAFTYAIVKDLQASASTLGLPLEIVNASTIGEIDAAFADFTKQPGCALLVSGDPFFTARRAQIVTLVARYTLPAIYNIREFPDVGGLISYGPSFVDVYRQVGMYAGRILKGERPGDLPVMQPTKFDLVINLKTAKALGIAVPLTLQVAADEVIE